jgi:hypothetical protein
VRIFDYELKNICANVCLCICGKKYVSSIIYFSEESLKESCMK